MIEPDLDELDFNELDFTDLYSVPDLDSIGKIVQDLQHQAEKMQSLSTKFDKVAKVLLGFATLLAATAVAITLPVSTAVAAPIAIALGSTSALSLAGSGYSFFEKNRKAETSIYYRNIHEAVIESAEQVRLAR